MVRHLIEFCLRQRGLSLLAALALALAGVRAWLNLPVDAFPDISPTQVKMILKAPGMTPEEVERRIVRPIEQEMLSIPRKKIVRSMSKFSIADITLDFDEGVDIYWARQQVSERLTGVLPELPASVTGGLAPITTPLSELYMFTVDGERYSLAERRRVLDWVIRPALRTVAGVADLNALGGEVQTYEVSPNPQRMARLGITPEALRQALMQNNNNDGAGRVSTDEQAQVVRVEGAVQSLEDLKSIPLPLPHGATVLLEDIAQVRLGTLTRYGAVSQDGRGETVEGLVLGLRGVNARQLVENVADKLDQIGPQLPPGMKIHTFYNRADLVNRATHTVIQALVEASVLVCLVLYLFLGGVRAAVVVALSLPLTLLITFVLMQWAGLTANLMSLGGLAIALGMLVDASVVVVENIESRGHDGTSGAPGTATPEASAAARRGPLIDAVRQVATPVIAGMLIIAVVFLPLLTLEDLEGKLFSPVAISIVLALGSSLLVAFTVVPVLASLLIQPGHAHDPWLMRRLESAYVALRERAWRHPRRLVAVALASLAVGAVLYTQTGKTFMPTLDEGDVLVQLQTAPSVSLESAMALNARVQQAILDQVPEVQSIVARTGSDELGLDPMGFNETDTFLVLKPRADWRGGKSTVVDALRKVLDGFPGLIYGFTQPIEMRVSEMLTGTRGDIAIKLFGNNLDDLLLGAQKVARAVRDVKGATEVIAQRSEGMPFLNLVLDRHELGQAQRNVDEFQLALRQQLEGVQVGLVQRDGMRIPLMIRGDEQLRHSPRQLGELPMAGPDGRTWLVGTLARIDEIEGPVRVDHEQGQRFSVVQVSVEGRDLTGFVAEARARVATLQLGPGVQVVWGGQFENQQRAAARLALVIPLALGLIFLILTLTFDSARQALVIFLNIPFALIGGMVALKLSGEYLSVPASVGFIALLGIAVLNGVVMVAHFNERRAQGETLDELIRRGSQRRLRPVLMTATITALGMIPLLFASGPGSEIQRPLAIVVVGGLVTSTLLTLLLLPLVYLWICSPPDHPATGRRLSRWLSLLLAFSAFGGSARGEELVQPLPSSLSAAVTAVPAVDAVDALAASLPQTDRAREAVRAHPAVRGAQSQAEALRRRADLTEQGSAEFTTRISQQNRHVLDQGVNYSETYVSLERPVRWWGKADLDASLADQGRSAANWSLGDAWHETSRMLLTQWIELQRQSVRLHLARRQRDLAAELVRQADARLLRGDVSRLDASLAQAELQRNEAAMAQAQAACATAGARLARSFPGISPAQEAAPPLGTLDAALRQLPPWPTLRQHYLDENHGLKLMRIEVERQQLLARRADRDRRPDPTLGVYTSSDYGGNERVIGVTISIPLPGQARDHIASAVAAEANAAEEKLNEAEIAMTADIESRYQGLAPGLRAATALDAAAAMQEAAAEKSLHAYQLGEHSMTELVQNRRLAAEQRAASELSRIDAFESLALLYLDLHQLWDFDQ